MRKLAQYLRNNPAFTLGISMLLIAFVYSFYKKARREKDGVFTIARVDSFEGAEQGADLKVTVFYNNKEYKSTLNMFCRGCIGNYYFIKILPTDPGSGGQLYKEKQVPYCYIGNAPVGGWKEIPKDTCQ